jgi:CRISPR-associated endonuclease/helicase Cas3
LSGKGQRGEIIHSKQGAKFIMQNSGDKVRSSQTAALIAALAVCGHHGGLSDCITPDGKTLSGLRFALKHAEKHGLQHIIYVIPYLSILEQTADEIRSKLGIDIDSDILLEHHSNIITSEENENKHRLLTSRKCVYLFNAAINFLTAFCRDTVLLCSATQPVLDKINVHNIKLSQNPSLINKETSDSFSALKRTDVVFADDADCEKAADMAAERYNNNGIGGRRLTL